MAIDLQRRVLLRNSALLGVAMATPSLTAFPGVSKKEFTKAEKEPEVTATED